MEVEQLYKSLNLPSPEIMGNPEYINVGQFVPATVPDLMEAIVRAARAQTDAREPYTFNEYRRLFLDGSLLDKPVLEDIDPHLPGEPETSETFRLKRAYLYRKACAEYNTLRKHEKKLLKDAKDRGEAGAPNFSHFMGYIAQNHTQALEPFFRPWRLPIVEEDRKRHTYISGKSGSRKSTLIKVLAYNYIRQNGLNGIIIFDPHGDLATEIAKMSPNFGSDKLIYFDPLLHPEYAPVINPFDIPEKSPHAVEVATNEFIGVMKSVFESLKPATQFTSQMVQILKPCVATLMIRPDSTLEDLADFMDDEKNAQLVAYALKVLKNPMQARFFRDDFAKDTYDITKQSIKTKLMVLFNSQIFCKCLIGKSTINLKREMDRGATIIFNLSAGRLSKETGEALGRFYIGLIQSIALQREEIPEEQRQPVHMFIDECELFVSEKVEEILKESRKYRLYLTLAQQVFGHKMSDELKQAILSNTAVKITGANGSKTLKTMNAETGADLEELQNLKVGEFHLKADTRPSIKMTVPDFLRNKKFSMSEDEWEETKARQLSTYYRRSDSVKTQKVQKREAPVIDMD